MYRIYTEVVIIFISLGLDCVKVMIPLQVISARRGEFETGFERGGQTREHAMLVKTAGVKQMVIVVNKMDDPTVRWDEER